MITTKIDKLGRVVIPISYRQKLNVKTDDTLVFSLETMQSSFDRSAGVAACAEAK